MDLYADDIGGGFYPTAQMPMTAPFEISWIYLTRPFVNHPKIYRCPVDTSTNWDATPPRRASYGINAYFTPNHGPYWGVRNNEIEDPSGTIIGAEVVENLTTDHIMPMHWGDPPAITDAMIQAKEWDMATQRPKKVAWQRHLGRANYVFTDGHAAATDFKDTWGQVPGNPPFLDRYDTK